MYNGEVRSSERECWATMAYLSVTWANSGGAIAEENGEAVLQLGN